MLLCWEMWYTRRGTPATRMLDRCTQASMCRQRPLRALRGFVLQHTSMSSVLYFQATQRCRSIAFSMVSNARQMSTRFHGLSLMVAYEQLLATGELKADTHQRTAVEKLNSLHAALNRSSHAADVWQPVVSAAAAGGGLFGSLFGQKSQSSAGIRRRAAGPMGLYIHGGTGSGKTRIMDLFYDCVPSGSGGLPKRRVHFHDFMLDVHGRLHAARASGHRGDLLVHVGAQLATEARLLCFDEFQVTDVGDAMIMKRLFNALWQHGLVMVATSNREPEQLYANGLQRELFVPFISDLRAHCSVHRLDSPIDYRLVGVPLRAGQTWLVNHSADSWVDVDRKMDAIWTDTVATLPAAELSLDVGGRALRVPHAVVSDEPTVRAARFDFADLCSQALYAADYQAIAATFNTVFLDHIPVLHLGSRNEVRRLITLIDVFYDRGVKLVVSAQGSAPSLFRPVFPDVHTGMVDFHREDSPGSPHRIVTQSSSSTSQYDEVFAWDRAVSRLLEMQTEEYLGKVWKQTGT